LNKLRPHKYPICQWCGYIAEYFDDFEKSYKDLEDHLLDKHLPEILAEVNIDLKEVLKEDARWDEIKELL
jgi:hypothetical protein